MTAVPNQTPASDEWTVQRVLDWSIGYLAEHGSDSPRLDAELLLAHSCNWQRIQLYTNYDQPLTPDQRGRMRELVRRRAQAEPVAYLIGYREFFGLDFAVSPAVLVPRPDTETLVRTALDALRDVTNPRVLDVGTGSGCIAVTLAVHCPTAHVTAVDISADALQVAGRNAATHEVADRITFVESDLFAELPTSAFDLIVSNPPYIRQDEMATLQPDVRDHEPHGALLGGDDGLDVVRRIVASAREYLNSGGRLMLEIDDAQAASTAALLSAGGFESIAIEKDLSGCQRVVQGQAPRRD